MVRGAQTAQGALERGVVGRVERRLLEPLFQQRGTDVRVQRFCQRLDQLRPRVEHAGEIAAVATGVVYGVQGVHERVRSGAGA
jgi:hypothetical protein